MSVDGRRIRARARQLSTLSEASDDDELRAWATKHLAKTPRPIDELRHLRDVLRVLGEALDPDRDDTEAEKAAEAAWGRIPLALATLRGSVGGVAPEDYAGPSSMPQDEASGSAPCPKPAPSEGQPARVDLAPMTIAQVEQLPEAELPQDRLVVEGRPAANTSSPWARHADLSMASVSLEPVSALAATAEAPPQAPAPALPFKGEVSAPPAVVASSFEAASELGLTMDVPPGAVATAALPFGAERGVASPDTSVEQYAWLCATGAAGGSPQSATGAKELDALWRERFKTDLQLWRRYSKLLKEYAELVARRRGT